MHGSYREILLIILLLQYAKSMGTSALVKPWQSNRACMSAAFTHTILILPISKGTSTYICQ